MDYRIFCCYRDAGAILAKQFSRYVKDINNDCYDTRAYGDIFYSDSVPIGDYEKDIDKIFKNIKYFIVFVDSNFTAGFLTPDGEINESCITAKEIRKIVDLKSKRKRLKILFVNLRDYVLNENDLNIISIVCNKDRELIDQIFINKNINNFDLRQGNEVDFFERLLNGISQDRRKKEGANDLKYFGTYPQKQIFNTVICNAVTNEIQNQLAQGIIKWESFSYNDVNNTSDNYDKMFYLDINYNNNKYRAIQIKEYRSCLTFGTINGYQSKNKYDKNIIYIFKWEPIKWRILKSDDEEIILSCYSVLDSQPFDYIDSNYARPKPNQFEGSHVDKWLNDTFKNEAFKEEEIKKIIETYNHNYKYSYHLTLLSIDDSNNYVRKKKRDAIKPTDYAKAMGVYIRDDKNDNKVDWGLRDGSKDTNFDIAFVIGNDFNKIDYDLVCYTNGGVVPCLIIKKE